MLKPYALHTVLGTWGYTGEPNRQKSSTSWNLHSLGRCKHQIFRCQVVLSKRKEGRKWRLKVEAEQALSVLHQAPSDPFWPFWVNNTGGLYLCHLLDVKLYYSYSKVSLLGRKMSPLGETGWQVGIRISMHYSLKPNLTLQRPQNEKFSKIWKSSLTK